MSFTSSTSTSVLPSPTFSASSQSTFVSDSWEKAHYSSLTLWDIDREFQKSHEAYEQWLAKNRSSKPRWRRTPKWIWFGSAKLEDEIGRTLRLGRQVQAALHDGIQAFGSKFEQGDSTCSATLSAQLLRVQHEIRVPLEDCALARFSIAIPRDELLVAAKGVRRTCLQALRDLHARLQKTANTTPVLPPPRFSVDLCPFAAQLQQDNKKNFQTSKARRHDRHDEREICPHCSACVAVSMHSGLPDYRRLLFQAHLSPSPSPSNVTRSATFACTGCYKTFEDSYGFLDHVFQKEVGSERSCQRGASTPPWQFHRFSAGSDPVLVDKCLRNCLKRELTRARDLRKSKQFGDSSPSSKHSKGTATTIVSEAKVEELRREFYAYCKGRGEVTMTFAKLRGTD